MHYTDPKVYEFISQQTGDPIIERRTCRVSGTKFPIFQSDKEFYEKISPTFGGKKYLIPFPTLCPEERNRRRMIWRNERRLYRRKCDFSGKDIISIYAPESPYKIYDQKVWRGDERNPLDFGCLYTFEKSFSQQFDNLLKATPQANWMNFNNENSDYVNYVNDSKNCYLDFGSGFLEDCSYCNRTYNSKSLIDCAYCTKGENSYSCIKCENFYKCYFCQESTDITNCIYCFDCVNCSFCIGCVGLRGKKFCVFNKQYDEKTYTEFMKKFSVNNDMPRIHQKVEELRISYAYSATCQRNSESSFGNDVKNSQGALFCYEIDDIDNGKYCMEAIDLHNVMDVNNNGYSQLEYENIGFGYNYHVCFNLYSAECKNVWYSAYCQYSSNLFGCIGLRHKQYCIFNKQYTKEEYETLVPKIIEHMQDTGERGEFFHPSLSPFGYNETVAQEYFPLTREEALARGYKRQDKEYPINVPEGMETIEAKNLPENIDDVDDDILKKAIICEVSGKPFRIIKPELAFYRKHKLSLPKKHPDVRHAERLTKRPGRTLYLRTCDKCGREMLSVYMKSDEEKGNLMKKPAPQSCGVQIRGRKQKVYCEACYQQAVYG